jgi:hypothetical protein
MTTRELILPPRRADIGKKEYYTFRQWRGDSYDPPNDSVYIHQAGWIYGGWVLELDSGDSIYSHCRLVPISTGQFFESLCMKLDDAKQYIRENLDGLNDKLGQRYSRNKDPLLRFQKAINEFHPGYFKAYGLGEDIW